MAITRANSTPVDATAAGYRMRMNLTIGGCASPVASPATTLTISNTLLQASCPKGPLRRLLRAFDDGLPGTTGITAGVALTQAQARALLLSEDATNAVLTNAFSPRAIARTQVGGGLNVSGRRTPAFNLSVDANVDSSGRPVLVVTAAPVRTTVATASSPPQYTSPNVAYVELQFCHSGGGR